MHMLSTYCATIGNHHLMRGRPFSATAAHGWASYWRMWGL